MKITDIKSWIIRSPDFSVRADATLEAAIIRVDTDEGISGFGEVCSSPFLVQAALEAPSWMSLSWGFQDLLVGRDPLDTGAIWEEVYRMTHYPGRRGVVVHALGAVDIALWDICGKATGLPLYQLLGGAFQREIPAYASHVMPASPEEVTELAARTTETGWRAQKFGWFPYDMDASSDLALVKAAREGCGPESRLMLDPGVRWRVTKDGRPATHLWDAKTAIQRIKTWEEFDVFWVEEPLPPDDVAGYCRLTNAVDTYIAAGEQESTRFPLYKLIERGAVDILQVDVGRVGGVTEARRVMQAAHDRNLPLATHCYSTGISLSASAHLLSASPNAFYLEYPMSSSPIMRDLVDVLLEVGDGSVFVQDRPGLGVEIDEELLERLSVREAAA